MGKMETLKAVNTGENLSAEKDMVMENYAGMMVQCSKESGKLMREFQGRCDCLTDL